MTDEFETLETAVAVAGLAFASAVTVAVGAALFDLRLSRELERIDPSPGPSRYR